MKVNGIIAEYNPFHNGHKYHLEESKRQTGADYTIIIMGGSFMQRGAPALLDKYSRTKMALLCGADLVLELPSYYAASSAEYFAMGSVSLLDKLGAADYLCFGSECGDLPVLKEIAEILFREPAEYTSLLRHLLKQGCSYPNARSCALIQYAPSLSNHKDVLASPNNILGIEYLKALSRRKSSISPLTTMRAGSNYHDKRLGVCQSSALAIRQAVFSRQDFAFLENQMPPEAYHVISLFLSQARPVHSNDFSAQLQYKLLTESRQGYTHYLDISEDLSDRIRNSLAQFNSFQGFCDLLKSKELTYTRISRCLLHILLNMKTETMEAYKDMDYIPYARVLGFRKDAAPLLTAVKKNSSIPLVTKLADADRLLDKKALEMLNQEIMTNSIYESALAMKAGRKAANEYSTPIVIV